MVSDQPTGESLRTDVMNENVAEASRHFPFTAKIPTSDKTAMAAR